MGWDAGSLGSGCDMMIRSKGYHRIRIYGKPRFSNICRCGLVSSIYQIDVITRMEGLDLIGSVGLIRCECDTLIQSLYGIVIVVGLGR